MTATPVKTTKIKLKNKFTRKLSLSITTTLFAFLLLSSCSSLNQPTESYTWVKSTTVKLLPWQHINSELFCEINHADAHIITAPIQQNGLVTLKQHSKLQNRVPFFLENRDLVRYHPLGNIILSSMTPNNEPKQDDSTHPIWPLLREQFQLDVNINQKRLSQQINWYAKHPLYMERVINRSKPYFYYVLSEIKKRGLPGELALLPIVESAYDPFAYSHGRASGMWQFIPGTGKMYNLEQNWWYDGRRDITESTRAALDFLEDLNRRFDGDWLHALAAYNSGGGTVNKAIRKNKKLNRATDFWSLSLPAETRAYVPKLLALATIFNSPNKYGLVLTHLPDTPQFSIVNLDGQIDLAQAALLADISLKELYKLNPGFNRWATDPNKSHHLLLPLDKAEQFKRKLSNVDSKDRIKWQRYTIRSGDNLGLIAQRNHTTVSLIKEINQLSNNKIRIGKTLLIPSPYESLKNYTLSTQQRLLALQKRKPANKTKVIHKVKSGESLWTIARKHGISTRSLAKWNGMAPRDTLKIGKKLTIWINKSNSVNHKGNRKVVRKIHYKVRKGDSLSRIANKFKVSISQLTKWNDISRQRYLKPGQALKLYVDVTKVQI